MKRILFALLLVSVLLVGCSEADVASNNVSRQADQFQVMRRIVFVNGITDKYLLEIVGYCSLGNYDDTNELTVTCKVGKDQYKKHFLGLSDNVTYVAEQIDPITTDPFHYTIIFRPEALIPDIDLKISPSTYP